ncbi:acyl-[acyl-carrier-protein] thioesterase [Lachnospiraceae bacterium OttesenSCG-928-D06]|nr:acyl-[acyl-carrier-protein] thioesterase [Lachnospiraceae bacterium OttesenSCG-928-D06]
MYSFNSRIRYSESDREGKLTLHSLLNYFQDCSTFQSEDLGVGPSYLRENHLVWVLASWQIVIKRYPLLYEETQIGTLPYQFKGFLGMRNFFMKTKEGEDLAVANSIWSLLDTKTNKPAIPPEWMKERYPIEEKLPMEYAPRKVSIPSEFTRMEPVVVRKHHIDTNHHVNNGQYVEIAMEYLPENFLVTQLRVEYKKQAFIDDILYPVVSRTESGYIVSLRTKEESPYVNIEFK